MNTIKKSIIAVFAVVAGISLATSCSDANEFEDAYTDNPSWVDNYTDSTLIPHPETLASTTWVRRTGLKTDAYGNDIQGFVESLNFYTADSVVVKMSEGATVGTWTDDSNTEKVPSYEYTYNESTGAIQILKRTVNDKGAVSKTAIFTGVAVSGKQQVITIVHYGDTPVQSYLVKQ